MATGERPPRDRGGGREGRRRHVTSGDARPRGRSSVTWLGPRPRRPAARSEPPARGAGERRRRAGRGARSASRPRRPGDPSPGVAGPQRGGAAAAFGLPRFLPARRTCDGGRAGAAAREGMKGAAAPPICAPRCRGGWRGDGRAELAAPRPGAPGLAPLLGPVRAVDKEVPWQRLPWLLPGRPRVSSGPSRGRVTSLPEREGRASGDGRAGCSGACPSRRARDERHCCRFSILLTDPCHAAGRCSARSRSWQRPCAAAGQTGPLAQYSMILLLPAGSGSPAAERPALICQSLPASPYPPWPSQDY
nr:translation initiation factor IF-2-like [Taeniopygia guttata]